jgi:hypothetical protein
MGFEDVVPRFRDGLGVSGISAKPVNELGGVGTTKRLAFVVAGPIGDELVGWYERRVNCGPAGDKRSSSPPEMKR